MLALPGTPVTRLVQRLNHHPDGQAVFLGKLEVALVVGGDGLHRSGAVLHQHQVADPDGNLLAVEGIEGEAAGEDAFLFHLAGDLRVLALPAQLFYLAGDAGAAGHARHQLVHQRVLGSQQQGHGAVDGVNAGGEGFDGFVAAAHRPVYARAFGFSDPVALHGPDAFRPTLAQRVEAGEQLVGVVGDLQKPLLELALLHRSVFMPPAAAFDHLLVGQHGLALGAPVEEAFFAVGQAALEHLQEEPLVQAVVLRLAGGSFARPIVAVAEAL